MSLTGYLVTATEEVVVSMGALGLFVLAFIESSFFPIPPDVALIPLALANPHLALFYAAVTTAGSVMGAVAGYYIGQKGGRPLLEKMVSDRNIDRVEAYYDQYGVMAVGFAGFTPVPYKVFTISSGTFKLDMKGFLVVSVLSRGGRFFLEALLIMWYGERIVALLEGYFSIITVVVAATGVVAYVVWKRYF